MATIKDVAAHAGVSVTTVSRTMNNRGYISQEMRDRINQAMAELDYRPNEVARSLTRQRTRIIGVLVPVVNNPFFAEVIDELSSILTRRNYRMMLYASADHEEKGAEYINMLKANQVDGIIIALRTDALEGDLRDDLPVVSFERLRIGALPTVVCDNEQGGRLAARELLDCGCRRPVMVGAKHSSGHLLPAFERFTGFRREIEQAGMEVRILESSEEIFGGDYSKLARTAFEQYPDADGMFCTSDAIASYIMQEALRLGKKIPDDLKVIGFNDDPLNGMSVIPLTSIRQPVHEMCEAAVDCLVSQIHKKSVQADMVFPVTLHPRVSTRGY